MHNLLLSTTTTTTMSTAATAAVATNHNYSFHPCKHSPFTTLDFFFSLLVLCSGTFLLQSILSYFFNILSLLLSIYRVPSPPFSVTTFMMFLSVSFFMFLCCGRRRSRRCDRPNCKKMVKCTEFDLQLQTEEVIKSGENKEIDKLPWKGGSENSPDYEILRVELRRMAPVNGRAVLVFRKRCGCAIAKLEGCGPRINGRRGGHKKALGNGGVKY